MLSRERTQRLVFAVITAATLVTVAPIILVGGLLYAAFGRHR